MMSLCCSLKDNQRESRTGGEIPSRAENLFMNFVSVVSRDGVGLAGCSLPDSIEALAVWRL